ncbi:MAG: response regulator [Desulfobulbaceae bacterium]|nr:response regulator [Desulfobulbaceae bacterium]HIJ77988.1 response regulator [Deltaproteobacteria bacterium]
MKKILVIDDESPIRKLLQDVLMSWGYEIVLAGNGKEGVRLYRDSPADLVITDLLMPEQDGVETIVQLCDRFPDVKIIAMSGGGQIGPDSYLPIAETLGAKGTLQKPIDLKMLREMVTHVLSN